MRCGLLALAAAAGLVSRVGLAQPWLAADVPEPLASARSVRVLGPDEPLLMTPSPAGARRGAAVQNTSLPLFAARRGPGCDGFWLMVGSLAWLCSARVEVEPWRSLPAVGAPRVADDGLPYRYHFVGEYGSFGYRDLGSAEQGAPDTQLEPGFAVALIRVRARPDGEPFGLTTKGFWGPLRDLHPARPFLFHGEELGGSLDRGWVFTESAPTFTTPAGRRRPAEHPQFTTVQILERASRAGRAWYRIGPDEWLDSRDVRAPTRPDPFPVVAPNERWIDVDRAEQVLTAYEGDRAVFATLVSTGRGREGTEQSTPAGDHRIWIKLRSSDMDNLEATAAERLYAIQDVPWVMYFERGYGLHGTFWHRSFGRVRSHGCVNLAPIDARRLFDWTGPRLPAGWSAVLPTAYDRGTLVHVR
jgi:hypothetical protein